jgi:FkbM family methyltransferase
LTTAGTDTPSAAHFCQLYIAAQLAAHATDEGGNLIKRLVSRSQSQLLQDIFCQLVLNEKSDGYFVEVGVGSGRSLSNSYMLEREYRWRGLLVEPNRSFHKSIENQRSAHLDRRAAASKSGQTLTFEEVVEDGERSRLAAAGTEADRLPLAGAIASYEVRSVSLSDLFQHHNAPKDIDFLSLDTEGSELDILEGIDFETYRFAVMTIEHNFSRPKLNQLRRQLEPKGYRLVYPEISEFDAWFVRDTGCSRLLVDLGR